jgi:hypothetical protein
VVGVSWGLWIDRVRESWVMKLDGWVCWWVSGGSELGLRIDRVRESWVKELDGWVQQQIGDSAWCVGDGQGRLQGVVA